MDGPRRGRPDPRSADHADAGVGDLLSGALSADALAAQDRAGAAGQHRGGRAASGDAAAFRGLGPDAGRKRRRALYPQGADHPRDCRPSRLGRGDGQIPAQCDLSQGGGVRARRAAQPSDRGSDARTAVDRNRSYCPSAIPSRRGSAPPVRASPSEIACRPDVSPRALTSNPMSASAVVRSAAEVPSSTS